jgi:tRNA1Val (adenine37-N6)-methyltransferase
MTGNTVRQKEIDINLRREGETIDDLLGGQLKILQKKRGYRFSVDSLLLTHFVRMKKDDSVIDLGTGAGVILLILSHRFQCRKMIGVEIQQELVDMARRSVKMNNLESRIEIVSGDIGDVESLFTPQSFNTVIFNPPYRKLNSGRINPGLEKAVARHEIKGTLRDFLLSAKYLVKEAGSVYLIYPAVRMVELLFQMRTCGIEPKILRMVYSSRFSEVEFLLMEGKKGGGEELKVLPPFFIYQENGGYTEEMETIFKEISASPSFSS